MVLRSNFVGNTKSGVCLALTNCWLLPHRHFTFSSQIPLERIRYRSIRCVRTRLLKVTPQSKLRDRAYLHATTARRHLGPCPRSGRVRSLRPGGPGAWGPGGSGAWGPGAHGVQSTPRSRRHTACPCPCPTPSATRPTSSPTWLAFGYEYPPPGGKCPPVWRRGKAQGPAHGRQPALGPASAEA